MALTNTSSAPEMSEGSIMGSVTVKSVLSGDAPLMRLASSSEGSIFSMARLTVMKA